MLSCWPSQHIQDAYNGNRNEALKELKDRFGDERGKAKTLNFGILYGQSASSLAESWAVSEAEAEQKVQAWFNARPEVKEWQEHVLNLARRTGYVATFLGRRRSVPDILDERGWCRGHAERQVQALWGLYAGAGG